MKRKQFSALFFLIICSIPLCLHAQGAIAGIDTNGTTFQIDQRTGALTEITEEAFNSFVLGGTTRRGNVLYYVAQPSGTSENALYTAGLKTSTLTHVDLDRNDSVRALFFQGSKLFGVLYDGTAGTAGVYRITPATGATALVVDLSDLDVEPIAGAFAQSGGFYYMLVKPEIDSTQRQLLRFKAKSGSAQLVDVVDSTGDPVLCDKLKVQVTRKSFVCLASAQDETQVNVCRLALTGKTTCLGTLSNVERVGSGHTMLTPDGKTFYAFVYAPDEPDNQHLITFNAKGVVKGDVSLDTIMIGAHFASDGLK